MPKWISARAGLGAKRPWEAEGAGEGSALFAVEGDGQPKQCTATVYVGRYRTPRRCVKSAYAPQLVCELHTPEREAKRKPKGPNHHETDQPRQVGDVVKCLSCRGKGYMEEIKPGTAYVDNSYQMIVCRTCAGHGKVAIQE